MGTTPGTSNITNTFHSIIYQLSLLFQFKIPNYLVKKDDLKDFLVEKLLFISFSHPSTKIVLFLDSIDQLSTDDYDIEWIINELPQNIKIIYSTLPNHGDILNRLKKKEPDDKQFVHVEMLNKSIVKTIIEDWLLKNKRMLSEKQWTILDTLFETASLYPLYVKLVFDIILKWESYYEPDESFKKAFNIDECIKYLFRLLEKEHGKMLFSRSMCYMTSFKNGISESELEDIISIDDDVLFEIFEFHEPPVRRFPVALWARIKNDLKEYMVEKETDDTRVIYW